ncbi:MAG: diguanylate cyclase [Oscillospiraceae bacterium]|nr:diguanylate cyclase [Oscillospiraceae bacterium]
MAKGDLRFMNMYLILAFLSLAGSIIIALLVLNHRDTEQNRYFSNAALLLIPYLIGYCVESTSKNFDTAFVGVSIYYLSYPYISPLMLLYAISHTGRKIRLPAKAALFIIPIAQSLLAVTSNYHSLYYTSMTYVPPPVLAQLRVAKAPLYYLCFAYIYIMLFSSIILLLKHAFRQKPGKKFNEYLISTALLIPVIMTTLYLFNLTPWKHDLTPVFLCATCALLCYSVLRSNYLQFLPMATSQMIEEMRDAFVVLDAGGCFLHANRAAKQLFPFLETTRFGEEIISPDGKEAEYFSPKQGGFEFALKGTAGHTRYFKASVGSVVRRGKAVCTTILYYDVTDTKNMIEELNKTASYDALTGIYNRGTLMRSLNLVAENVDQGDMKAALLMMDIDHFKEINDRYGHQCGDTVLKELAVRVSNRLRHGDVFGRYGGEEFCIAACNISTEDAMNVGDSIRKIIGEKPYVFEDKTVFVTVSIGISFIEAGQFEAVEDALARADAALYEAKRLGRNRCLISQSQL